MKLITDRSCLRELYSSVGKIFIAAVDRQSFLAAIDLRKLELQLKVYCFDRDRETIVPLQQLSSEFKSVPLTLAPNFCLALVSFSNAGKQDLAYLSNWWRKPGSVSYSPSIPSILELDSKSDSASLQTKFWQQISVLLSQQNQKISQRITTLQKQYLSLRTLHENMQNAFATVEDYLSQAKLPPLQLAFEAGRSKQRIEPSTLTKTNSLILKQLLPRSSRGLAVIELHVAHQQPQAVGYLKIRLQACEDTEAIALWQIPYAALFVGWLSLDLPSIDLGRQRDVELIVEWHTEQDTAPALSLTKIQPIPEARCYTDDLVLERSLAIKIWQGLPGTRNVTSPYLLSGDRGGNSPLGYLGQGAIAGVKSVTPRLPTDDFEHIRVFDRGAKILTHPRADGTPTIAMLPFCFPATANQSIASIITEHEAAGIIEYALAIIEPAIEPLNCLNHQVALAFSDWIAVRPQDSRKITLNLTSAVTEPCHIVIATRLAAGSTPEYGWAHWLNFYSAKIDNPPASEERFKRKLIIKPALLRNASTLLPKESFPRVQSIEDGSKIQVHPIVGGDTVAVISEAVSRGTSKVVATVCTENEEASLIEYAIAIITVDDDAAARKAIASAESTWGFSGWQPVAANTPFKLKLNLVTPMVETGHLVLATRIPEGGSQNNAWARWLDFELA